LWITEEINLLDPEFPEYLKMVQMGGIDNYIVTGSIGLMDINGQEIYEEDIIKFKENKYRVYKMDYDVLLECLDGEGEDVDPDEIEVIGNTIERGNEGGIFTEQMVLPN
jgi:hypothetical protein